MDPIKKVKILKMLTSYLTNKDNVKLFYDILITLNEDVAFECVGHFENLRTATNATQGIKTLLEKIKKKEMLWKDSSFERMLKIEQEEDEFLETPLEVAEGAIKCKCGSERVYSFSKQTRSGDESTTVFALCTACKSKWVL
jgi:DNA-directed RNA polymerase subunit M/transcription elongation factor TFIIS